MSLLILFGINEYIKSIINIRKSISKEVLDFVVADLEASALNKEIEAEVLRLKAFVVSDRLQMERAQVTEEDEECEYESEYGCMHDCATCSFGELENSKEDEEFENDEENEEVEEDEDDLKVDELLSITVSEDGNDVNVAFKLDAMEQLMEDILKDIRQEIEDLEEEMEDEEVKEDVEESEKDETECKCTENTCECESKCNCGQENNTKNEKKEKIKSELKAESEKVLESLKPVFKMVTLAGGYSAETLKEMKEKVETMLEEAIKKREEKKEKEKVESQGQEEPKEAETKKLNKEDITQAVEDFFNQFFE